MKVPVPLGAAVDSFAVCLGKMCCRKPMPKRPPGVATWIAAVVEARSASHRVRVAILIYWDYSAGTVVWSMSLDARGSHATRSHFNCSGGHLARTTTNGNRAVSAGTKSGRTSLDDGRYGLKGLSQVGQKIGLLARNGLACEVDLGLMMSFFTGQQTSPSSTMHCEAACLNSTVAGCVLRLV